MNDQTHYMPCEFIAHGVDSGIYCQAELRAICRVGGDVMRPTIEVESITLGLSPELLAVMAHGIADEECRFVVDLNGERCAIDVSLDSMLIAAGWLHIESEELACEAGRLLFEGYAA